MAFIPCILHMENRVRIKMLTMLAIEVLSSTQGKRLAFEGFEKCTTDCQRKELYIKKIEDIINKKVLACAYNPVQWYLPTDKKSGRPKEIGTIKLRIIRSRKFWMPLMTSLNYPFLMNTGKKTETQCKTL